ncbi:MAG TPA: inorganic diphosphatase [Cyclobacteriaceae bacterium]|nr:inorganic diphosphatase [Cyclobacteriaceae bacterium]
MNSLIFNPWHHVNHGDESPDILQAVIEIPKGTKAKYELDKTSGMLRLDRVLYTSSYYPANYGLIPKTLGEDHDPLDIVVLSQVELHPMCIVRARVIGVMRMVDNDEADDKIIAVAADDVSVGHLQHVNDLPDYFYNELRQFFEVYKKLERKVVLVDEFQDASVAKEVIMDAIDRYNHEFNSSAGRNEHLQAFARFLAIHGTKRNWVRSV